MNRVAFALIASTSLALAVPVAGCADDACSAGHVYDGPAGVCRPAPTTPADTSVSPADGSATDATAVTAVDAGPDGTLAITMFGLTCADHSGCVEDTNYCVIPPGQAAGYCSHTDCDGDASLCPDGWSCFDLGQFVPGLPHICQAPAPEPDPGVAFGEACTDDESCGGDTDFCMKQPGQSEGYCSATGCDVDASICPEGWICFDLGAFSPGLPHACMNP